MERTVVLHLDSDAGELGVQKSRNGEKHRIKITTKEFGRCILTGNLKGVHYGSYDSNPAALLLFEFNFHFTKSPRFRYKSADIKVTFSSTQSACEGERTPDLEPVVCGVVPERVYGEAIMETKKWRYEFPLSANTSSLLPLELGMQPSISSERSLVRGRRMEIHGSWYNDKSHSQDNIANWSIFENPADQNGIPHKFYCAAIVAHHDVEFQAEVEVKLSTGLKIAVDPRSWGLAGRPWTKDDPIIFDCKVPVTPPQLMGLGEVDLSKLREEQWRLLVPLVGDYEVPPPLPLGLRY
jgi:hypothetical protein